MLLKTIAVTGIALAISACNDTTSNEKRSDPRPQTGTGGSTLPQTSSNQMYQTNRPPTVGIVNPVTIPAGGYLNGVLDADDPDRATGDRITSIQFSALPSGLISPTFITVVDGQTRHNYSISIPNGIAPQQMLGVFTVSDSRGLSASTQFNLTIQGSANQPIQSMTKEACKLAIPIIKTGDLGRTLLTLGCNFVP